MKELYFRRGAGEKTDAYLDRVLTEIADASLIDALKIADEYTVTNFTATRALDAGTATATQVANVLATFIDDLQRRGSNRSQ